MTMAFEDDMIDAGFNDPMEYMDYLMDEGDRIMQRLIEEEDRMRDWEEEEPDVEYDESMEEDWEE